MNKQFTNGEEIEFYNFSKRMWISGIYVYKNPNVGHIVRHKDKGGGNTYSYCVLNFIRPAIKPLKKGSFNDNPNKAFKKG